MRTSSPCTPSILHTPQTLSSSRYSGGSMWPVFQAGDVLILRSPQIRRPRPGDCIVFRSTGPHLVAHRLLTVHPVARTKGDALLGRDEKTLSPDAVLGVVVGRIRNGAYRRVRGGRMGLVEGRILPVVGRIRDERPPGKGRRVATLIHTVVALLAPDLASRVKVTGSGAARLLRLGGRPFGRVAPDDRWVISWPYSLFVHGTVDDDSADS